MNNVNDDFMHLAEDIPRLRRVRGIMRLTPGTLSHLLMEQVNSDCGAAKPQYCTGSLLTYDEEHRLRMSKVVVSNAGTREVNGEYTFAKIRANAGSYERIGTFQGNPARFALYKCSLRSGGYQWFISITPPDQEPGTSQDIDFYFSHARHNEMIPPAQWFRLSQSAHGIDPIPKVEFVSLMETDPDNTDLSDVDDVASNPSDSELMLGDDSRDYGGGVDDSYASDL